MMFFKRFKFYLVGIFLMVGLTACTEFQQKNTTSTKIQSTTQKQDAGQPSNSSQNKSKSKTQNRTQTNTHSQNDSQSLSNSTQTANEMWSKSSGNRWFVKGEIKKIDFINNTISTIEVKVTKTYTQKNEGVPYALGVLTSFRVKPTLNKSHLPFKVGDDVFLNAAQYRLSENLSSTVFNGATSIYYKHDGNYEDLNGNLANFTYSQEIALSNGSVVLEKVSQKKPDFRTKIQTFFQNQTLVSVNKTTAFRLVNLGGGAGSFQYEVDRTTNDGKSWKRQSIKTFNSINGISFINSMTGFLVQSSPAYSTTPTLFITQDSGKTWTVKKLPIPDKFSYKNGYYRSGGVAVFLTESVGVIPVFGITNNDSNNQFLYMLITRDGGQTWHASFTNSYKALQWSVKRASIKINFYNQKIEIPY